MNSVLKRLIGWALAVGLIAMPVVGFVYRQNIYDWWRLRGYEPPSQIQQLSKQITLTDSAKKVFYVYHPTIAKSTVFNQHCPVQEFSIVLGCYSKTDGIYLYDVTEKRLDGVTQVTAAHEFLHAAYDRLGSREKSKIDAQIMSAYKNLHDSRIKNVVAQYQKADPSSVSNELHSILGTEVSNLPSGLEQYYKRYFTDRAKIVSFSNKYESEFTSRQEQVKAYDKQLTSIRSKITNNQEELSADKQSLDAQRSLLLSTRGHVSTSEYNASADKFNQQVAQYNALAAQTTKLIDDYNALVKKRNNIAVEVQNLTQAIDSTPEKFN